ncbi:hypothetical protein [Hyphomicrobium sp. 2TAF46]|uniref:hypothetical protein n=1 Tax=Hyphomicrobium sp. 2TAF46 TaxID=3233019 RepID=UPI003F8EC5EB
MNELRAGGASIGSMRRNSVPRREAAGDEQIERNAGFKFTALLWHRPSVPGQIKKVVVHALTQSIPHACDDILQ